MRPTDDRRAVELDLADLRAVSAYAAATAETAIDLFEHAVPGDARPRQAIAAAWAFARGGARVKALRDAAWAAQRAATDAGDGPAAHAARAAMSAASAAYLHPLADAHQVKHILGAAAFAARAAERAAADDRAVGASRLGEMLGLATPEVAVVLRRYPAAPPGGGRVGELLRQLDEEIRRER